MTFTRDVLSIPACDVYVRLETTGAAIKIARGTTNNLGKTFPWTSRIRIIPSAQILARVFTSFHFPDSGLYLSDGFDFYFDLF